MLPGRRDIKIFLRALLLLVLLGNTARAQFFSLSFFKNRVATVPTKTLIQDDATTTSGGVLSFTTPPQPGNFVFVTFPIWNGCCVTTVTDNQGNTYQQAFMVSGTECAPNLDVYGYYALNVASNGGTFTVTVNTSAGWLQALHLREYSGVVALDKSNGSHGTSGSIDSGPITTTLNGELYIASQSHCATDTTTPGAGWTHHVITTEDSGSFQAFSTEDIIGGPAGTYHGTFSITPSDFWTAAIASFR